MRYYIFRRTDGDSDEVPQWTYVTSCEQIEKTKPYMTPDKRNMYGVFEYQPETLTAS